jgi:hypothetical protein
MPRRKNVTRAEAEVRAFKEVTLALDRYQSHPNVYTVDAQRLLAACVARYVGYRITLGLEKP